MAPIKFPLSNLLVPALSLGLALFLMIPTPLDPVAWRDPAPLGALDGSWSANNLLNGTAKYFVGSVTAPESMAIDSISGKVYLSLNDGRVVAVTAELSAIEEVVFIGGFIRSGQSCGLEERELLSWCQTEARARRLAWNETGEIACGRPLGLRLKEVEETLFLFILDAYHGLFSYNTHEKILKHLVGPNEYINYLPTASTRMQTVNIDPDALLPLHFFNDLDVTKSGTVYFTDSSYKNSRSQNRAEVLDGAPRGRLFSYSLHSNKLSLLLCGLHFPNGVQLLPDEESLLFVESGRFRVLKLHLKRFQSHALSSTSPSAFMFTSCAENGTLYDTLHSPERMDHIGLEIFLESIPGYPDNIRIDKLTYDRLYLGIAVKSAQPFSLLYYLFQGNLFRHIIGRLVPMKYIEKFFPKYGLVGVIGLDGSVQASLHDPKGNVILISEAQRHPLTGDIWLGSHAMPYLGVLKKEYVEAIPGWGALLE